MEDEAIAEPADEKTEDIQRMEQQRGQDGGAEQVKVEADRGGHYRDSRKRPYEENRGYGYYEHREDKRYALFKLWHTTVHAAAEVWHCQW